MHHRNVYSRPLKCHEFVPGEKTEYDNTKEMYGHTVLLTINIKEIIPALTTSFEDSRLAIIFHERYLPRLQLVYSARFLFCDKYFHSSMLSFTQPILVAVSTSWTSRFYYFATIML